MKPFLLSREDRMDGYTRFVYDLGVDKRATVTVLTTDAHRHLDTFDPDVLTQAVTTVRPPLPRPERTTP